MKWKNLHMLLESFRKVVLPILTLVLLVKITFSSYNTTTDSLLQNLESTLNKSVPFDQQKHEAITQLQSVGITSINHSEKVGIKQQTCNLFEGKWIPFPYGPYYTNETNCAIDDRQNCMKFGRLDRDFIHWRWKPDDCELPLFDAMQFLELVRGKTLAFVGDSLARNQMQSLVCLLASAAIPVDVSETKDTRFRRWLFKDYNFTIIALWSPQLIKSYESDPNGYSYNSLMDLYLDKADDVWASQVDKAHIIIISGGQWFFRPFLYYENGQLIGCHKCNEKNTTKLSHYYGYRMAFRTAFKTLLSLKKLKSRLVILRPFSPQHFENGEWNKGGNCNRTRPFTNQDIKLDGYTLQMYLTQLQEFKAAQKEGKKKGVKFRLLDTTEAMLLRPDGHPNNYGHWPNEKKLADCVHWCMPGPVDTWNELLLSILKMEAE
ncbi:protein trichome birefringence-like 19 [Nicotiana tabacum]|uniref:Protein trichome birefringence-like 19 n=2 Tax=Nicotiana TaxID=4085 RepID=A0A1S4DGC7_TOBAC|nr:PREDICTED: protein trichome birefringence-like 19 [Nicotiana sylvestris]XP_016512420.1 PREDICTED: protein trichome birefringence-like 19 [Nicotiana tabacum]